MMRILLFLSTLTFCSAFLPPSYCRRSTILNDGGVPYNPITHICCFGKTIERNAHTKCCLNSSYDSTEKLCCEGVIQDLKYGLRTRCCGTETYDLKKQICCGSSAIDSPSDTTGTYQCCGNQTMDPNTNICYENTIIPKDKNQTTSIYCGNKTYDYTTEQCCYSDEASVIINTNGSSDEGCCNGKAYNTSENLCCSAYNDEKRMEVLIKKDNNQISCCGTEAYDLQKQLCCDQESETTVVTKDQPDHTSCCNGKSYSYETGICCENTFYQRNNTKDYSMECCEDKLYDSQKQTCCFKVNDNGISKQHIVLEGTACCGTKGYNIQNQICCDDTLYDQDQNKPMYCCDNKLYDINTETCCGGQVAKKSDDGQTGCSTS